MTLTANSDHFLAISQRLEVIIGDEVQNNGNLGNLFHRLEGVFASVVSNGHPQQLTWSKQRGRLDKSINRLQDALNHRFGKDHLVFVAEFRHKQLTQHIGKCLVSQGREVSLTMRRSVAH